jgi:hypothetical protein
MRSLRIVVVAPTFLEHSRLVQRIEEFAVEQFDLPWQTWSRMNMRLDRNQGSQGHAQETIYANLHTKVLTDSVALVALVAAFNTGRRQGYLRVR